MTATLSNVISRINTSIKSVVDKEVVAQGDERFFLMNGESLSTLDELGIALARMSDEQYNYHVNDQKNDFADWVEFILQNPRFAVKMKMAQSRQEAITLFSKKTRS